MSERETPDVSAIPGDIINAALEMSLEWGEYYRKPIQARICAAYPGLTAAQADALNLWCIQVRDAAFDLIAEEYEAVEKGASSTAMQQVRQKYPQIDDERASRLYSQGLYYAWHG